MVWPAGLGVLFTLGFSATTVLVPLLTPDLKFENRLFLTGLVAMATIIALIFTTIAYAWYHRANTWVWGKAELVQAVWTGGRDEADQIGLTVLLMPISVLFTGLDVLLGMAVGRNKIVATRVVGDRLETIRTDIGFVPESGTAGYTWICRATIWPRRWYALGDLIPGGTMYQYIPPEAIEALSAEILRIRKLNAPQGGAYTKPLPGLAKNLPGKRPAGATEVKARPTRLDKYK